MIQLNPVKKLPLGAVGVVVGGLLVGLPLINQVTAQTRSSRSSVNPCPRIYYEEPYNSTRLVPSGCQANAFTQSANTTGSTTSNVTGNATGSINNQLYRINPSTTLPGTSSGRVGTTAPAQPPLPESLGNAIATVLPINGRVDVMLRNKTGTTITYEVIGHTQPRSLAGGAEVMLQDLPVPVTITTLRPDRGLVQIAPIVGAQAGAIGFALDETTRLGSDQEAIRIQNNGQVLVN
ncbi:MULTISPECIES: hypothetical protein [Trichocoleus]|uniref:Uncharacterized protein n=1 Tax=Trichocoleus desertorum GB2-A4 TaxID=2933944 RepID=A0ABV0J969_9CYAN|nr:hypothetical protein [Trichocoleus sp. FACHB-46]MBD1864698.1 hypothetical protein [Trichocoleus sp. FACHB-46]